MMRCKLLLLLLLSLPLFAQNSVTTANGLTSTGQNIITTSGHVLLGWTFAVGGTACFVQFFNTAIANVSVGTTAPNLVVYVPASTGVTATFYYPVAFSTALSIASTITATGSSTCTVAAAAIYWR